ncbi:MAG: tRNA (adenosine(37)-N6)-dimethylallyltransferase MiaA [Bacteroides sp.]|nr:tRNA (adenosine(37)-N6)-dimethylallyltransferase MiaA [Roseburia sp.]MCM1345982.1 tRNA (adenosine(37)-N6)-dimethylallyltransferase MiaA [Bacteroides sp.]MCM1419958.1 tRNA (adenosine(37)-N6)-dimethylallyltransferase MiaA [Bacteroides sp.]
MLPSSNPKTLIVLIGPTGVGKTKLSLSLAKHIDSPIISADSRQIYNTIRIGTAAPSAEELSAVRHYFVGTLNLEEYYSAAQYEADVMTLLEELFRTHDKILLTGGSMMYIDAVTKGIDDIPTIDEYTRKLMKQKLETEGLERLTEELRLLDPEYYNIVDLKNHKRVVHALEICYMTGKTYTSFRKNIHKERPFHIIKIGLRRERENLFARINARVDDMMENGLLEEARSVSHLRHLNSLNTVGYKELFKYMDGEWNLGTAVERIKKNTRVYAKKQMTWFKHDEDIDWLDADNMTNEEMVEAVMKRHGLE